MNKQQFNKFQSKVAEFEAILYSDDYTFEQKHHMVIGNVLGKELCESGNVIYPDVDSTYQTELQMFYDTCCNKLQYLK